MLASNSQNVRMHAWNACVFEPACVIHGEDVHLNSLLWCQLPLPRIVGFLHSTLRTVLYTTLLPGKIPSDAAAKLMMVMNLLSKSWGTFLLTGYFTAFPDLPQADREKAFLSLSQVRFCHPRLARNPPLHSLILSFFASLLSLTALASSPPRLPCFQSALESKRQIFHGFRGLVTSTFYGLVPDKVRTRPMTMQIRRTRRGWQCDAISNERWLALVPGSARPSTFRLHVFSLTHVPMLPFGAASSPSLTCVSGRSCARPCFACPLRFRVSCVSACRRPPASRSPRA